MLSKIVPIIKLEELIYVLLTFILLLQRTNIFIVNDQQFCRPTQKALAEALCHKLIRYVGIEKIISIYLLL